MIRKPFKRYRSTAPIGGPSRTKQSFKEDCDVNVIVNRFVSGGELTHLNRLAPQYGDVSNAVDLQAALELVEEAWEGVLHETQAFQGVLAPLSPLPNSPYIQS